VARKTTRGAWLASNASCQRGAHKHPRSPGFSRGTPNSGIGVERSLPRDLEKSRNSEVITTQTVSLGIKRPKGKEIRSWTDAEIRKFEGHWPIGTKQRLAFALMLYTGQRRGDVHRMIWADVSEGSIHVVRKNPEESSGFLCTAIYLRSSPSPRAIT